MRIVLASAKRMREPSCTVMRTTATVNEGWVLTMVWRTAYNPANTNSKYVWCRVGHSDWLSDASSWYIVRKLLSSKSSPVSTDWWDDAVSKITVSEYSPSDEYRVELWSGNILLSPPAACEDALLLLDFLILCLQRSPRDMTILMDSLKARGSRVGSCRLRCCGYLKPCWINPRDIWETKKRAWKHACKLTKNSF